MERRSWWSNPLSSADKGHRLQHLHNLNSVVMTPRVMCQVLFWNVHFFRFSYWTLFLGYQTSWKSCEWVFRKWSATCYWLLHSAVQTSPAVTLLLCELQQTRTLFRLHSGRSHILRGCSATQFPVWRRGGKIHILLVILESCKILAQIKDVSPSTLVLFVELRMALTENGSLILRGKQNLIL